jgi:hypothetical protein
MALAPPIHITGNPNLDWIVAAVGFLVALYWLRALRLARQGARRFLGIWRGPLSLISSFQSC